jgi:hypothetical protein
MESAFCAVTLHPEGGINSPRQAKGSKHIWFSNESIRRIQTPEAAESGKKVAPQLLILPSDNLNRVQRQAWAN